MSILVFNRNTEITTNVTQAKVVNAELDEEGHVTIYLAPDENTGLCHYIVLTKTEFEIVKEPFDLTKPDGQEV